MKLVGLMPVRNEAWCLGLTLRVALQWCDEIVVMLHACRDESAEIVVPINAKVTMLYADDSKWDEMDHRQRMLEAARVRGATHIAIVDADEFLTANLVPRIRPAIEATEGGTMLELPGYNTRERPPLPGLHYHLNGIWGNRWFSTAFRDMPSLHWAGDRFHKREPFGCNWVHKHRPVRQGDGGVVHLWGASERRLRAKHALYKITERLRWPEKPVAQIDQYYNLAIAPQPENIFDGRGRFLNSVAPRPWTFDQIPAAWLAGYDDWIAKYLHVDAEPWQEAEVRLLLQTHGRERFAGLDLLGY